MTLTFKPRPTENSTRVIDAIQVHESEGLLRQVLQQLLHPLDKRRQLIWILLRKSFINLQGLFKCLPRILRSVLGAIQNAQIVERRGDVRQIGLSLFLRKLAVNS